MALETLRGIDKIGTEPINHMVTGTLQASLIDDAIKKACNGSNIVINDKLNIIAFRLQNGPVKTNGKNGCQVQDMIATAATIISELNNQFPCKENDDCIRHLNSALAFLSARTKDREARGVEGYSKA